MEKSLNFCTTFAIFFPTFSPPCKIMTSHGYVHFWITTDASCCFSSENEKKKKKIIFFAIHCQQQQTCVKKTENVMAFFVVA